MTLSDGQRDMLLRQIAEDTRAIRRALDPEGERPASTRKKDPRRLYGDSNGS